MRLLKQSTARTIMVFMTDATDRVTGKTGLTLTVTASKNGAAFASVSPAQNERGNGWYSLDLTTSHTDTLGDLAIHVTGSGADPTDLLAQVVADLPGASVASVSGAVGSVTGNVGGNVVGSVASVTGNVGGNVAGSVASVTAPVTVGTNNDKTGYALSSGANEAIADAVWDEPKAGHATGGTFGGSWDALLSDIWNWTQNTSSDGSTFTSIPWNPGWDAEVQSEALDALNEYDPPTNAELTARTLVSASYATASDQTLILADTNELQTDWANGGRLDLLLDAVKAKADNLPASPAAVSDIPTANQNADALLDRANAIETGWTLRGVLRVMSAALLGKSTGADTGNFVFRNITDSKDRVTAETDANGRTDVTLDGS